MQNRIAEARKAAGISQAKLAELSGIPRRTIQDWEAQKNEPGIYKMYQLAQTLNCSLEDLLVIDETE